MKNLKEFIRHEQYIVETGDGITKDESMAPEPLHNTNVVQELAKKIENVDGETSSSSIHIEESLLQLKDSPHISCSNSIKLYWAAKSPNISSKMFTRPILEIGEEM